MKTAKNRESFFKSFIWRVLGFFILGIITFLFTRDWVITTMITFIHHATFLLVFYLHERVWILFPNYQGRKRRITKALIYEIILGMGIGGLIVYLITSNFPLVTQITGTYTVVKIITYYIFDKFFPEIKEL